MEKNSHGARRSLATSDSNINRVFRPWDQDGTCVSWRAMHIRFLARVSLPSRWGKITGPKGYGSRPSEIKRGRKKGARGSRSFPASSFLPFATSRRLGTRQRLAVIRGALLRGERASIVCVYVCSNAPDSFGYILYPSA